MGTSVMLQALQRFLEACLQQTQFRALLDTEGVAKVFRLEGGETDRPPHPQRSYRCQAVVKQRCTYQRLRDGRAGALLAEMRRRSAGADEHPGRFAQHYAMFIPLQTGRLAPNRYY
ncbi:MAG: hypothetical protein ACK57P_14040 [Planctomycetota bacterium]